MKDQLISHVKILFDTAPKTKAAMELREELTANCIEKYNDLVSQGMEPKDAYQNVLDGIGNVSDLFQSLEESTMLTSRTANSIVQKRTAIVISASVGMYILAGLLFLSATVLWNAPLTGLLVGIAISIVPTCLLVYRAMAYPNYEKQEETVVENFKEWDHSGKQNKVIRGAISSVIWTLCVIIYFLISFATGAWSYTWLLFLVAACVEQIVTLCLCLKQKHEE